MKLPIALALTLGLFAGAAHAETSPYTFDTVHSKILFKAKHLGFSWSYGEFTDFSGSFDFDSADWSQSQVKVTIPVDSLEMGDATWNEHLRAPGYFNLAEHAEMQFVSTRVEKLSETTGKLHGDLTVRGVTKPVVLDLVLNQQGPHPFSKKPRVGFSASGVVQRSEFGLTQLLPIVGDEIHLIIEIEAGGE